MAKKTAKKKAPAKKAAAKKAPAKKKVAKKAAKKTTKKKAADGDEKPVKKKKKAAKRKRTAKVVRLKAYWGVFSQSLKRVELFEYNERKQADKKAADLSKKSPHFVQPVKEIIDE
ncbi:hypothetical protein [Adhaeretor mobilis]|uniref:Uncharacterized protein n=1 Tax=Adhaeretor mobilis TaxID=1930276 RepID=A0A517MQU8_9BACT|nr:hypothetical protein [Adhaeretor mobilis]QDS97147.1 hypothetical protein HG15A2_04070 [Adhaeretor mobilis]